MKQIWNSFGVPSLFLLAMTAVSLPSVAFAESGALSVYSGYCQGSNTDIFTGIAHNDDGTPKITVDVDPVFRAEMKKQGYTATLPVTPVYNLVVTAVPTIFEYCLPQYDTYGVKVSSVSPPKTLPFSAYIIIGKSSESSGGVVFLTDRGTFTLAGKDADTGEWKYEWKVKGWPNGIAKEEKMAELFKAMAPGSGKSVNVRMEIVRPNKQTTYEIAQVPFEGCKQLTQSTETKKGEIVWGRKKIITMHGLAFYATAFQRWVNGVVPGTIAVTGRSNVSNNTRDLRAEITAGLAKGYHVLAIGHSFGSIVTFGLKDDFPGKCADFVFVDPPYNDILNHAPLISKLPIFTAIEQANGKDIEHDPGTVNWTNGRGLAHFYTHHPFILPLQNYRRNPLNLERLKTIILDWKSGKKDWTSGPNANKVGVSLKDNLLSATALLAQSNFSQNTPGITKLSSLRGPVGSSLKISGLNFGTKATVYFENDSGGFAWTEGLPVKKEGGLDAVSYTIPSEMSTVAITADGEGGEIITKPVSLGSYSVSLSGSDENALGSELVPFEVMQKEITRSDLVTDLVENEVGAVILSVDGATDAVGVKKGEEAEVKWEGDKTIVSCRGSWNPTEKLAPSGTARAIVNESGTFSLSCLDAKGNATTASVIVTAVNPPLIARIIDRVRGVASSERAVATPTGYPVRKFVLDTLGKPSTLVETAEGTFIDRSQWSGSKDFGKEWADAKGTLTDTATGQVWDIEYEQKGNSRKQCRPPVLNLSFDKKTKKGKLKPLFVGRSTYENYTNLSYQKIRLVPECDVFDDGWSNKSSGFANTVNQLLRESVIYDIARSSFGLPVVDIVALAELTVKAPDIDASKSYRYIFLQRDNEQDDEKPFTMQFGLSPTLIEASDAEDSNPKKTIVPGSIRSEGITAITYTDIASGENKKIPMDPENAVRISLLYQFVHMNDHFTGWNEDYGIDTQSGFGKIITYDFDLALQCQLKQPPSPLGIIQSLPSEKQATYKMLFASVSREIFGSAASLDGMLRSVDGLPLTVDKDKLKAFIKIQFYTFSTYFGSEAFAKEMGVSYEPFPIRASLPNADELQRLQSDFLASCGRPPLGDFAKGHTFRILPNPVLKVTQPARTANSGMVSSDFRVEVTAGIELLKIHYRHAFSVRLQKVGDKNGDYANDEWMYQTNAYPLSNLRNENGVFIVPSGQTAVFEVQGSSSYSLEMKGAHEMYISKISLGADTFIVPDFVPTNAVTLGDSSSLEMFVNSVSPSPVPIGDEMLISGRGFKSNKVTILEVRSDAAPSSVILYTVQEKDISGSVDGDQIITMTVPTRYANGNAVVPGKYSLQIFDMQEGFESNKVFFEITAPAEQVKAVPIPQASPRFIRLSRAPASETFQPQVLPIGRTPAALGSFEIVSSEPVRLSPPVFRLGSTGSGAGLRGIGSFELWQIDPIRAITSGRLSESEDGIVFRDPVDLRQGISTFVVIASPIDRFVPDQRITLSASFWKDDVEATSTAEPKRFLNFPKNEVRINTLTAVLPSEGEKAPAQANMPAEVLRAPARKGNSGEVTPSVTAPTISGSSANGVRGMIGDFARRIVSDISGLFSGNAETTGVTSPVKPPSSPSVGPDTKTTPIRKSTNASPSAQDVPNASPRILVIPCGKTPLPSPSSAPAPKSPSQPASFGYSRDGKGVFTYTATNSQTIDDPSLATLQVEGTHLSWTTWTEVYTCHLNGVYVPVNGSAQGQSTTGSCSYTLRCVDAKGEFSSTKSVTVSSQ